jgi:hypothetical protein
MFKCPSHKVLSVAIKGGDFARIRDTVKKIEASIIDASREMPAAVMPLAIRHCRGQGGDHEQQSQVWTTRRVIDTP